MSFTYAGIYTDSVTYAGSGASAPGVLVAIRAHGAGVLATLYTDRTKATTASNPVLTDGAGNLTFYAVPGLYDCIPASGGSFLAEVGVDPADVGSGSATHITDLIDYPATPDARYAAIGTTGATSTAGLSDWPATPDARYAAIASSWTTNRTLNDKTGYYVPAEWGQFWRPKLAAATAGTQLATIAVAGDSIGSGSGSSDLRRKSWVGLMITALQAQATNGGSGYYSIAHSSLGVNANNTWYLANTDGLATVTGAWTTSTSASVFGPGFCYATPPAGGGGTFSFPNVVGTSVTVWYMSDSQGTGTTSFTITIDGGSPQTVTVPNTGTTVLSTTVSGLSNAGHTVLITDTSTSLTGSRNWYLNGVSGTKATGVRVDNYSHSSYWSAALNGATTYGPGTAGDWSGGYQNPCDLLIMAMGVNDNWNSVSAATYAHNVAAYLLSAKEYPNAKLGSTDILLVLPPIGKFDYLNGSSGATYTDNTKKTYHEYAAALRGLAEDFGAAFINTSTLARHNWNYMDTLGYMSVALTASPPGPAGHDDVHLSDAGHAWHWNQISPLLTATS